MVSTRQMSIVSGCATSNNDSSANKSDTVPSKLTRNSTVIATAAGPSTSKDDSGPSQETTNSMVLSIVDMPQEIVEKVFSYLSFKNICHIRPVCRTFDRISGQVLNTTFQRLQSQMLVRFQSIKSKMPRRESARRNHPLACESDIVETLHMRLTLLQMSFGKHIERKHCCFFPGEILDEVYRILHYIKVTPKLARPYKVTDELFDLSTMAMEYFKEKIEPDLPEIAYFSSDFLDFTNTFHTNSSGTKYMPLDSSPLLPTESKEDNASFDNVDVEDLVEPLPQSNMVLRKGIRKIKQGMKRYNNQLSILRQDLRSCKRKTAEQQKQIAEQQKLLAEQQKQTLEYATRLDENDKKNEETSRKFSTLLQELNKCKTELQYWRSKSPATPPVCNGCGSVIAPLPREDLQALMNQGVMPEGLGLHMEPLQEVDFIPIAGGSAEEDIVADWNEKPVEINPEPASPVAAKAASVKRKAQEDPKETPTSSTESKKGRRLNKIRNKRVKVL